MKETYKKLGLDISPVMFIDWSDKTASTAIEVETEDGTDVINVNIEFESLAYSNKTCTGYGNITFSLKTFDGKTSDGTGIITYADLSEFKGQT